MAQRRSRHKTRHSPRSNPRGTLQVTAQGFGFVQTSEGEYFIPASKMGTAFDGDLVEIAPAHISSSQHQGKKPSGQTGYKPTARVVSVINRSHDTIVGRYEIAEPFGVVVPLDAHISYDIFTMHDQNPTILDGDIVRVRITNFPSRHEAATGVIEEVIGHGDAVGMDVEMIIANHKLETEFSEASLIEAQQAKVDEEDAFAHGYRNIKDRFIWTIDPVDARDFDDALSLEKVGETWRLGVHIADVAHYVPWGSSIDLDARRRATSVYLVDRVVPMLPEALSGSLCSLMPGVARRSMTVDIFFDEECHVTSVDYYPSIICSDARLSYDQAQVIIDAQFQGLDCGQTLSRVRSVPLPAASHDMTEKEFSAIYNRMPQLYTIAKKLESFRLQRGGMEFKTTEAKVHLDKEGHPEEVVLRRKTEATMCVEEAMILANHCVATYLNEREFPCIYRVHEAPLSDSLQDVWEVLQEFDISRTIDSAAFLAGNPLTISKVLQATENLAQGELISSLLLRSMQRAVYKINCLGHYGLADEAYCHFTSPIRRYPDLVVHRMLRAKLGVSTAGFDDQVANLAWLAEHSSKMERVAEAAARESQEMKLVEYMADRIGTTFDAIVSGVATYGIYVRLDNTAEGLVPIGSLGHEYFALNPKRHTLTGQESGRVYRLGQSVRVVLRAAIPAQRKLDFRLYDDKQEQ